MLRRTVCEEGVDYFILKNIHKHEDRSAKDKTICTWKYDLTMRQRACGGLVAESMENRCVQVSGRWSDNPD